MPTKTSVLVLFNHVGEDEYEKLREIDPESLGFKPEYDIHVATVMEEYEAIVTALNKEGFNASALNLEDDLERLHDLLSSDPPDVIFNLVEYFRDDPKLEQMVAGIFDLYRVPYTGAGPFALALCQRKGLTKQLLLANGVLTPRYHVLHKPHLKSRHGLRYPLIVKPAREDASTGVENESVVYNLEQLNERIVHAFKEFTPPILVEEFIEGRELHVSVFGNDSPNVFPIIEYDFSKLPPEYPRIISYAAKWEPLKEEFHRVDSVCPAKLSKRVEKKVREQALLAYETTSCRDYARIDVRLSKENKVYILEVNPNPDLTESVSFMESAEKAGFSFSETLRMIVEMALQRKKIAPAPHG
ncbi:MAG: ATP-grasp domain-containing protein [Ignavibacteriales bacterium]|nr:ATP-grasp domain-containing protein [Ignavibacteriales bacterium]